MEPDFKKYAKQIVRNAQILADIFIKSGFDVVAGGTDKHLILIDLRSIGASAWIVALALEYANIVVNRNTVPFDTGSSMYPSGIRLGTPAITTRGMKEREMKIIGNWIVEVIRHVSHYRLPEDKETRGEFIKKVKLELGFDPFLHKIGLQVTSCCQKFPVP